MRNARKVPRPDAPALRRLSVQFEVDPRSILREIDEPGSVRGMAGERARRALREYMTAVRSGGAPPTP